VAEPRRHLVTGATGFIGGALALELLSETIDEVVCLVRAPGQPQAERRLRNGLRGAAQAYDRADLLDAVERRCGVVVGDITRPLCGVDGSGVGRIDEVWHAAASLKYLEKHAAEIRGSNVDGTRHVLELAERLEAPLFNYVSTAYVAGGRTGEIREEPAAPSTPTNNYYERSKIEAEQLVAAAPMRWRVLRPSVVIGHSRTYAASSSFGIYGAFQSIARFQRRVRGRLGGYLRHYRAQLLGEESTRANLVPVDQVVRNAVQISRAEPDARIFHLCNATPPTVMDACVAGFALLGLREPQLVATTASFTALDRVLDQGMDFYASYMKQAKSFDRTNTDAVCGREASAFPMDRATLTAFLEWYLHNRMRSVAPAERLRYSSVRSSQRAG
jgi:nucleoside-diphosphate-sugar epimerase